MSDVWGVVDLWWLVGMAEVVGWDFRGVAFEVFPPL